MLNWAGRSRLPSIFITYKFRKIIFPACRIYAIELNHLERPAHGRGYSQVPDLVPLVPPLPYSAQAASNVVVR